jgi:hypothetical protein
LQNLSPERARLLFPDFLLPSLRADTDNNALIASGSPALLERLKRDVSLLDRPRPQVTVEAQAYEFQMPEDQIYVLSGVVNQGRVAYDTDAGAVTVNLLPGQQATIQARLQALITQGRARLAARPSVTALSGEQATLFLGQTRFLPVLTADYSGSQQISILPLLVGVTLSVQPTTSGGDADILLNLKPKFSTVDSIEAETGLPVIGTREISSYVRVRPGDTVLVGVGAVPNTELAAAERARKALPTPSMVYAGTVHSGSGAFTGTGPSGKPRPIHLLKRGNIQQPQEEVQPAGIAAFNHAPDLFNLKPGHAEGERRLALARWIAHDDNPLFWRVIVNRVWRWHFGRGLVETPNDLGRMGDLPEHRELHDFLAGWLREQGGSLHALHKLLLTSTAYRRAATNNPEAFKKDPDNRLWWHGNRRKLDAEVGKMLDFIHHRSHVQQRLGRDATDVQTDASERRVALDDHRLQTQIGSAERG